MEIVCYYCRGFNTQPPEGGWSLPPTAMPVQWQFQHTAARRRLDPRRILPSLAKLVSTHSRPKAAGKLLRGLLPLNLCFNTQPPEGGWKNYRIINTIVLVSTHSRPKAAGGDQLAATRAQLVSTHSRPKAAGPAQTVNLVAIQPFQHTAARRRLGLWQ